jgi:hypothetical protein
MRPSRLLACIVPSLLIIASTVRADEKREIVVRAGATETQINNHPWSYTTPGSANTNCSSNGNVYGTVTNTGSNTATVNGTVNSNTNCSTTYNPATTTTGNRVTVNNEVWVKDIANGDSYLIECTAGWAGSKCSPLLPGIFKAEVKGNNMWITGRKGMKTSTAKYHILRFDEGTRADPKYTQASTSQAAWSNEETYTWQTYRSLSPEDKDYVRVFCAETPKGAALVPHSKVLAAQSADHAVDCSAWLTAKSKTE